MATSENKSETPQPPQNFKERFTAFTYFRMFDKALGKADRWTSANEFSLATNTISLTARGSDASTFTLHMKDDQVFSISTSVPVGVKVDMPVFQAMLGGIAKEIGSKWSTAAFSDILSAFLCCLDRKSS